MRISNTGINENVLGPEHPNTSAILRDLARLLRARGDLKGGRPLYERALKINKRVHGATFLSAAKLTYNEAGPPRIFL
jgi:hypothetical protein